MKRCLTAIVLGLAATSALAADDKTAWNAGVAAMFGEYEFDDENLEDSSAGFKLFTGYRFNKWFGLEGAYHNFGDFEEDLTPGVPGGDGTAEIDGFSGSALLYAPLPGDDFDAFVKGGYYFFDQQGLVDDVVFASNSPDGLLVGGGMDFYVSDQFSIRAEGEWFEIDDGQLWAVNLGIQYLFGRPAKAAAPVAEVAAAPAPPAPPPPPPPPPADTDGDGVIDEKDQCPDTPKGDRVGPQGCTCDITRQVQFAFNSAELTEEDKLILDEVAGNLARLKFVSGTVIGHTDSIGPEEFNQQLSERRAQSVVAYLESRGIEPGRLAASGAGESEPIADNSTAEGRALNRRVVLRRTDCESSN